MHSHKHKFSYLDQTKSNYVGYYINRNRDCESLYFRGKQFIITVGGIETHAEKKVRKSNLFTTITISSVSVCSTQFAWSQISTEINAQALAVHVIRWYELKQ